MKHRHPASTPARGIALVRAAALVALMTVSTAFVAPARAETYSGEYVVTFLGLTIARSTFNTRIEGGGYAVDGTVASAGVATIMSRLEGTSSASGSFGGDATRPHAFRMDYAEGKRRQITALGFRDNRVVDVQNDPPLKKRGDEWVKVTPADLKGVTDPLSAGLVKASGPGKVCGRTLKLFDGEFRMDARLHPAPNAPRFEGYGDEVVLCRVTVKPVAGYRKGRRALDYLQSKSRIMIAFAPLGASGLYAPVYGTVGTEIGTVTVKAKRFATPG